MRSIWTATPFTLSPPRCGYRKVYPGSLRAPLSAEQRRKRPPSVHPVFLTHPLTGKTVLYCNPGYATRINELDEAESSALDGVGPIPDGPVTLGVRLESVRLDRVTGGRRRPAPG